MRALYPDSAVRVLELAYTVPMSLRALCICLITVSLAACTDDVFSANDASPGDADGNQPIIDAGPRPDAEQSITVDYAWLSETGLYQDIASRTIAADIIEYAPEYRSWYDGAIARTWIWLPPDRRIDTSDMDYWYFPVGTKVWQQLSRMVGQTEVLLETRMIQRTGPDDDERWTGSFVWLADDSDAAFTPAGAYNVRGTTHDVPMATHCFSCHRGQPSTILGFAAVQLSYPADVNLNTLAADGLLTNPPETQDMYPIPGNSTERAALGHLQADCAHCHSSGLGLGTFAVTGLSTRLFVGARTVEDTDAYQTNVGQALTVWSGTGYSQRMVPGAPDQSGTLYRMSVRGGRAQMPPRFTEVANTAGVAAVRAWIDSL
jgi:hypothetical protein